MKGPSPRRLKGFAIRVLRLGAFFCQPGDRRTHPRIPAADLLWSLVVGQILREGSFHGVEALIGSPARRQLGVTRGFGDDALGYFTERLDLSSIRQGLVSVIKRVKRNRVFQHAPRIGLALDGTGAGRCSRTNCPLCHPVYNAEHAIIGYQHHFSMISVVGTGLSLPFDVEPYAPGESEHTASFALLQRAAKGLGTRFADYVVGDGLYANAPFLHAVEDIGWHVVVRLKGNLPELFEQARSRFALQPPSRTFEENGDRIELWDTDDFDPWSTLRWATVRVLRYRQHKTNGAIIEAYWLTDYTVEQLSSRGFYHLAKSRWEIENQGFNEGKTYHAMEHITHHQQNALVANWLLILLALILERLYRRFLHRGNHPLLSAIALVRALRLHLGPIPHPNTS